MSYYNRYSDQSFNKPSVISPIQHEIERVPDRFCDFMNEEHNRFSEICKIYLGVLSMDDLKYLKPHDLINLVPKEKYDHRLLMTIMVRRYLSHLCPCDDKNEKNNKCSKCNHSCYNSKCDHVCDDYIKINHTGNRHH